MALGLVEKKEIVENIQAAAKSAVSAVVVDACGVTVDAMTVLRKEAREAGVWMKVVRNTLARRALKGTDYECLMASLEGPSLIAFSSEHPGAAARIFKAFSKDHNEFELKLAAFEGQLTDISLLASLPTYDEAIAKLMGVLKEASAGKLVRTLAAVSDQKQQAA